MPATNLPNLGLGGDTPNNEDNWDVQDRANLRRLDALTVLSVKDKDLAAPPGSPADGDRYIVGPSPSGAWAGQAGKVAVYNASTVAGHSPGWDFYTPRVRWTAHVEDEEVDYVYSANAWQPQYRLDDLRWMRKSYHFEVTSALVQGYTRRTGGGTYTDSLDGSTLVAAPSSAGANKAWEIALDMHVNDEYIGFGGGRWFQLLYIVGARVNPSTVSSQTFSATTRNGIGLSTPWQNSSSGPPQQPPWNDPPQRGYARLYYVYDVNSQADGKLVAETGLGDGVRNKKVTQFGSGFGGGAKSADLEIIWNPYVPELRFRAYSYSVATGFLIEEFVENDLAEMPNFRDGVDQNELERPFCLFTETGSQATSNHSALFGDAYRYARRGTPAPLLY
jgi:uncharacterized protein DUF2793